MDRKRLEKINAEVLDEEQRAYNILTGEADNYDGADGGALLANALANKDHESGR